MHQNVSPCMPSGSGPHRSQCKRCRGAMALAEGGNGSLVNLPSRHDLHRCDGDSWSSSREAPRFATL
eukprot:152468-Chlamydomonas_euryale.AAC.1